MEQAFGDEARFVLQQSVLKSELRVQENRPRLIDFVVVNLHSKKLCLSISNPSSFILERCAKDPTFLEQITMMRQIDHSNAVFWNKLNALVLLEQENATNTLINAEIQKRTLHLLHKKSTQELQALGEAIREKLVEQLNDYDYWEFLAARIERLLLQRDVDQALERRSDSTKESIPQESFSKSLNTQLSKLTQPNKPSAVQHVASDSRFSFFDNSQQARKMHHKESNKKLGEDEQLVDIEVPLVDAKYPYQNPIKPRYHSKVRAIYEWNKYNQTHYDVDNPPPKTTVGYEFHVFYPLLKNPTLTPQFKVTKGDADSCILYFTAGEPYSDLAFKIVSEDWDTSTKHGFKCQFDNGILLLKFNLRRSHLRNC